MRRLFCLSLFLIFLAKIHAEDVNPWRAGAAPLAERIERLAEAGEVDAALSVLKVLLGREKIAETGLDERSRMSVARALAKVGRTEEALELVKAMTWADKDAAKAAGIVALELDIRYRAMFDREGVLRSGAIIPRDAEDSAQGQPGSSWLVRRQQAEAFFDLLERGARMVKAEGGTVNLPGTPLFLNLARYAHHPWPLVELQKGLGDPQKWTSEFALALARLHLEEHDAPQALAAAEILFSKFPDSEAASQAFVVLRTWQVRRQILAKSLVLWQEPTVEARLDVLAKRYTAAAIAVQAKVEAERDVTGLATRQAVETEERLEPRMITSEQMIDETTPTYEPRWTLALDHDGLKIAPHRSLISAGDSCTLTLSSQFRGRHQIAVYRLPDRATWDALLKKLDNRLLPTPCKIQEVTVETWGNLGTPNKETWEVKDLEPGFYVATAMARGAPVVPLTSFAVVAADLTLIAGRDEVLAWVVNRQAGTNRPNESVHLRLEPVFHWQAELGARFDQASAAFRAGFAKALGSSSGDEYVREDQKAEYQLGQKAGLEQLATLPKSIEITQKTGADGLIRWRPGEAYSDRSYIVKAELPLSPVPVQSSATFGHVASWTAKTLAWADRPLVRPGETLHWRALLRSFDGDRFKMPVGEIDAAVLHDRDILWQGRVPVGEDGSIHGSALVPPAIEWGSISLRINQGIEHHLANVRRLRLPDINMTVEGVKAGDTVRAGEEAPLAITLRDSAGLPLEGVKCDLELRGFDQGEGIPGIEGSARSTDATGRASWSIPTLKDRSAFYKAVISCKLDGKDYFLTTQWNTTDFPFVLESVLRDRDLTVGDILRLELRLPKAATVEISLCKKDVLIGKRQKVSGQDTQWVEVPISMTQELLECDQVEIRTATLDGRFARRLLPIAVKPRPVSDDKNLLRLEIAQRRLDPGQLARFTLGSSLWHHDALVLVGARSILDASTLRLEQAANTLERPVDPTWAPKAEVQAMMYESGKGFVLSTRTPLEVRPIDRLLRLTITPDQNEPRPGDEVRCKISVRDWQDTAVAKAHLSLGVINELLYQLQEDDTPDLLKYFHTYDRSWLLEQGISQDLQCPSGLLWRSIIRRWYGVGGAFGCRGGGGRGRAIGCHGGTMRSERGRFSILPESETAIFWVGDLSTDAKGEAEVRFTFPQVAGRFRLTARANDTSARLMVGEVRQSLAAARPVEGRLDAPSVASAGDELSLSLVLRNCTDTSRSVEIQGKNEKIDLPAKVRRQITLRHRLGSGRGPVVEAGGILGRVEEVAVEIRVQGEKPFWVKESLLVALPGLPERHRAVLQADDSGLVSLPVKVPTGAAIKLVLEPFGDGAGRIAAWSLAHRQDKDPSLRAAAWLLAQSGEARRTALANVWPTLGNTETAALVRQIAAMRQDAQTSGEIPANLQGSWLRARGRSLSLGLSAPTIRGQRSENRTDQAIIASVARLETWGEGPDLWRRALSTLDTELSTSTPSSEVVTALAIMADTAKLLKDESAQRLAQSLSRQDWNDPLVAILATTIFADEKQGPAPEAVMHNGESTTPLSGTFATWTGIAGDKVSLRARARAIVGIDLTVQSPPATTANLVWWQQGAEGFERREGNQLLAQRATILELENPDTEHAATVRVFLPSFLIPTESSGEVLLIDWWQTSYPLDQLPLGTETNLTQILAKWPAKISALGSRQKPVERKDMSRDGAFVSLEIEAKSKKFIAMNTPQTTNGSGPRLAWNWSNSSTAACISGALNITEGQDLAVPTADPKHPEAERLTRLLPKLTNPERDFVTAQIADLSTAESWTRTMNVLDPDHKHTLDQLLAHPFLSKPGHWSGKELRIFIDTPLEQWTVETLQEFLEFSRVEPVTLLDQSLGTKAYFGKPILYFSGHITLEEIVAHAQYWRFLRIALWNLLPQPQEKSPPALPTVRVWMEWFDKNLPQSATRPPLNTQWLWQETLPINEIHALGYDLTLDGWAAFVRSELGEDLVIDPSVSNTPKILATEESLGMVTGEKLGSESLAKAGLGLIRDGKRLTLKPIVPRPFAIREQSKITVKWEQKSFVDAVAELDRFTQNRGLGRVEIALEIERVAEIAPVTQHLEDIEFPRLLYYLASITRLNLIHGPNGWIFKKH